jgi:hypothetical protein
MVDSAPLGESIDCSATISLNELRLRRAHVCLAGQSNDKRTKHFEHPSHAKKNLGGSGAGP